MKSDCLGSAVVEEAPKCSMGNVLVRDANRWLDAKRRGNCQSRTSSQRLWTCLKLAADDLRVVAVLHLSALSRPPADKIF